MLTKTETLPTPSELQRELPLPSEQKTFIASARAQVIDILEGRDSRMLLIMGPCSVDDPNAAMQYAMHLKQLAGDVEDTFLILMRVYFEKPRTVLGWKGMLYDPDLNGSHNICKGMRMTRKLLLDIASLEVPAAAELLDPCSANYFADLLAWSCVGARTVSSQIHRQMASGLSMPIAFKNSTDGNIEHAVNGVKAASARHTYLGMDDSGRIAIHTTQGNPYCNVVLRGGESKPNYDPQSVTRARKLLREAGLPEQLIIDCSHDNCTGVFEQQGTVFQSAINQRVAGNKAICGIVVESYLHEGNQRINAANRRFGVSVTDPCINWTTTEQLVRWAHGKMNSEPSAQAETAETLCIVE